MGRSSCSSPSTRELHGQFNRFDSRERPTAQSLKYRNVQGEQATTSTATYDNRGQVLSEIDANGNVRTHRYNALGMRVETTDALSGKTLYSFDVAGNLLEMIDAKVNKYKFEYDRNDRLIKETLPLGQVTEYRYDAVGNLSKKTDSLGNQHIITSSPRSPSHHQIQHTTTKTPWFRTLKIEYLINKNTYRHFESRDMLVLPCLKI